MANQSFTLNFTRQFTKGNLKGLTHDDKITYPTKEACESWVKNINKSRKLDYKVISYTISGDNQPSLKEVYESALESARDAYFALQANWDNEQFAVSKENKLIAEMEDLKAKIAAL